MKKILVTGGAGFIGSHLCEFLVGEGYDVVCLDNFSTGSISNIIHLLDEHPDTFTLVEGDIRSFETCIKATTGVEYVLHEAALGSIPRSINDPITTNDVNVGGFLNMLVAARDMHVKRFVFATSSSIYGDIDDISKVEEKIGEPLSPYALTKYVDEMYAKVFSKLFNMEYIGLRYFNVFGQRQDPNSMYAAVIPLFIKKYIEHKAPVINGDGTYSRDFTYVRNVIHMNMLALKTTNPVSLNRIYNTAGGETTTINQLATYIRDILSSFDTDVKDLIPQYGPTRKGDIPHSLANIEKAKHYLGYVPQCSFIKGLEETVEWYWNNRSRL